MENDVTASRRQPWNKNKLVGQKPPLKLKEIWAIRVRLQLGKRTRDLAMFNLAIDSKLRGCDLVSLRVRDITHGNQVAPRAIIMQQKTQRPVQFELTEPTRELLLPGSQRRSSSRSSSCFQADSGLHRICRRGSMRGWSIAGWPRLVLTRRPMAHTRCVAPKSR